MQNLYLVFFSHVVVRRSLDSQRYALTLPAPRSRSPHIWVFFVPMLCLVFFRVSLSKSRSRDCADSIPNELERFLSNLSLSFFANKLGLPALWLIWFCTTPLICLDVLQRVHLLHDVLLNYVCRRFWCNISQCRKNTFQSAGKNTSQSAVKHISKCRKNTSQNAGKTHLKVSGKTPQKSRIMGKNKCRKKRACLKTNCFVQNSSMHFQ